METIQITCEPVAKYRILSSISQGKKWLSYKDFANRKHSGNHWEMIFVGVVMRENAKAIFTAI